MNSKNDGNLELSIPRCFQPPRQSYFLFGPRGTGKTTWLRSRYPDALLLDLLQPDLHRSLAARPERLRELVHGEPDRHVVILDEVQRLPELLHLVHALREERAPRTFVLTGSSARKLRRGGVDLLAGRVLLRTLHPFLASELGDRFELATALRYGLVPIVAMAPDPADVLRTYADLYLEQEVRMEGLTRNVGAFSRFLEAISFSHGGVLSVSAVARDCEVNRKVVEGYVGILEDLLLAFRVPVFDRRAKRALTAAPKLYLFDAGVFRSLRPAGPLDRPAEIDGSALEGLVAQHLRALSAYRNDGSRLHHWRTRAGLEVDLVLYGPSRFLAVEVKNAARVRTEDLRGLRAFREDYPEAELLLLHRGAERLLIDGIPCVPVEPWLRSLRVDPAPSAAG